MLVAVTAGRPDHEWMARATDSGLRADRSVRGHQRTRFGSSSASPGSGDHRPRRPRVRPGSDSKTTGWPSTRHRALRRGGARPRAPRGPERTAKRRIQLRPGGRLSLGSLVAGAAAAGFSVEDIYDTFERGFVRTNPTADFVPPAYSLIRGAKTRRLLREAFGDRRIEAMPLRFFCLSCDLIGRQAVVHTTGPVVDAIYASLAIPGVFPHPLPPTAGCSSMVACWTTFPSRQWPGRAKDQ